MAEHVRLPRPAGFLADYVKWAGRQSDAPEEFHLFVGLTILAAAAARLRLRWGRRLVAPSLWTVLVAPSAFYRKTTAVELGRGLLAAALPEAAPPPAYHPGSVPGLLRSGARLAGAFAPGAPLACVGDFSWLLLPSASQRLTQVSDQVSDQVSNGVSDEISSGASDGESRQNVSLLSTISTAALGASLNAVDLAAGYLARFSFVVARDKREWRALPGPPDPKAESALVEMLRAAARLEGEVSLAGTRDGLNRWGRKMTQWMNTMSSHRGHFFTAAGFATRLELTVLKLAVLIEVSRRAGNPERTLGVAVSDTALAKAERLAAFLRLSYGRLINQELRHAGDFRNELGVMMRLRRMPGITRRRLQQNSHMDAGTLRRILERLSKNGHVERNGRQLFPAVTPETGVPVLAQLPANGHL